MKKPIDPNLNSSGSDGLFDVTGDSLLGQKKTGEEFTISDKETVAHTRQEVKTDGGEKSEAPAESKEGEHRHHSSDGSHHHHHHHHHHHSSGSHSSSGSHHSSSADGSKKHSSKKSSHRKHSSKKKKKLPVTARIAIAIIALIVLLLISAVVGFFVFRQMGKNDVMPDVSGTEYHETIEYEGHTYQYNTDIVTLGFLGIDQRTLEKSDDTNFVGASDADIVVAVDTKTGKVKVISIPRDTMVDIAVNSDETGVPLFNQKAQLCLAYAYGDGGSKSCENTTDAMSRILYNVPIQKYYALDLDGIAPLNDAIGGVTLVSQLDSPEDGIYYGEEVTLKGDMAERYVRLRSLDDINASLYRSKRQVQYVKAYANQALPAVLSDFSVVASLYNTATDYSQTNLSLSNATYIASLLLQKGTRDFDAYTIEGEMKAADDPLKPGIVHAEFYPDEDSVMKTVIEVFYTRVD